LQYKISSLVNPSFIFVARKELIKKKESGESLSHVLIKKKKDGNLFKIGDDILECLLELDVEFLCEDLLVVTALRSKIVFDEVVVEILDFVRSNNDGIALKVARSSSCDLKIDIRKILKILQNSKKNS